MRERPILFSGAMVRAILDGTKTQTRRVMKPPRLSARDWQTGDSNIACPYGEAGDRLWVRETWVNHFGHILHRADFEPGSFEYGAKGWKPSIHMPRAHSRLSLDITGVRVERLQDISAADKEAEGLPAAEGYGPAAFADLWDQINAKRGYSWASNPWVWVVSFARVRE